jgi:hypothetical protein
MRVSRAIERSTEEVERQEVVDDALTHDARGVPVPPQLPDGWRDAQPDEWVDHSIPSRRRWFAVRAAVVAVVAAAVIGAFVWVAAGHYARGVEALRAHAYSRAMGEFAAAKILVVPYRDAQALEDQARRALESENAALAAADRRVAAVVDSLDGAHQRLGRGDAAGVLAALQAIPAGDLRAALADGGPAAASVDALTTDLGTAALDALQRAEWTRAGRLAAALLVLEPSSKEASALADRALVGERLRAKLAEAKDAAQRGRWRDALRLALAVTAVRKDFPGAATLIADARRALAPKPKPKPTTATAPTPAATTAPPTSGGGGTTTPTQPPPP